MALYALPADLHYVDTAAAAQYEAHTGEEIVMAQRVNVTVGETFDAWIQQVWLAGSEELQAGKGRGYVNQERLVPQLKVHEQIKSAGLPADNDSKSVASILYKVTAAGSLPITDHIALVRFVPDNSQETPVTEIVWTIKLKFAEQGNEIFPTGAAVSTFLQKAVPALLAALAKTIEDAKAKN